MSLLPTPLYSRSCPSVLGTRFRLSGSPGSPLLPMCLLCTPVIPLKDLRTSLGACLIQTQGTWEAGELLSWTGLNPYHNTIGRQKPQPSVLSSSVERTLHPLNSWDAGCIAHNSQLRYHTLDWLSVVPSSSPHSPMGAAWDPLPFCYMDSGLGLKMCFWLIVNSTMFVSKKNCSLAHTLILFGNFENSQKGTLFIIVYTGVQPSHYQVSLLWTSL